MGMLCLIGTELQLQLRREEDHLCGEEEKEQRRQRGRAPPEGKKLIHTLLPHSFSTSLTAGLHQPGSS
ncbi:unnamed protein product [Tetraodon nigroviridis]|uniref:Chromosome 14 SCAF14723, whole genome shotgun sequence n=1 Tax=Tetraodon nigroviridis TaxID=99883 RepID=Q4S6U5_TETNG|nr:unnamed protein product [Tetraodon nigroviridis]